ncbi:AtpZ/AtpI family protein, partial [Patescibacteria group bacterium]|nr:AtpZ/AtpI family protein [Patescibacteria group bacterium]
RKYLMLGFRIVGEFGFIIAAPIVILALLGKWLDGRYDTAPLFLVSGFILAALLSAVSIYRRAKQFGREYSSIEPEKTPEKSTSDSEQTNHLE